MSVKAGFPTHAVSAKVKYAAFADRNEFPLTGKLVSQSRLPASYRFKWTLQFLGSCTRPPTKMPTLAGHLSTFQAHPRKASSRAFRSGGILLRCPRWTTTQLPNL